MIPSVDSEGVEQAEALTTQEPVVVVVTPVAESALRQTEEEEEAVPTIPEPTRTTPQAPTSATAVSSSLIFPDPGTPLRTTRRPT